MKTFNLGHVPIVDKFTNLYVTNFEDFKKTNELLPELIKQIHPDEFFIITDLFTRSETLLHILARYPDIEYELLFQCGNDLMNLNRLYVGCTPLYIACQHMNEKAVKSLLSHGANVNLVCLGYSPLMRMAKTTTFPNKIKTLQLLVDHGADIHLKDGNNENALHQACYMNDIESAKYLVDQGSEYNLVTKDGMLPIDRFNTDELKKEFSDYIELLRVR